MRIAVFGYYNTRNEGDARLQQVITHMLGGQHELVFLLHHWLPPISFLREFDWILIGGGELVQRHVGIWCNTRDWITASGVRIGVMGLGAKEADARLAAEIRHIVKAAQFFFVRDAVSKRLLADDSRIQIAPDLSWGLPLPVSRTEPDNTRIAVNLGWCPATNFEPESWLEVLKERYDTEPMPFYFGGRPGVGDEQFLAQHYSRLPERFTLDPMEKCWLTVACRYHAITYAIQLRRPFVAISYDDKVERLCQQAGLSEFCLKADESGKLEAVIERARKERAEIIRKMDLFASAQEKSAALMRQTIVSTIEHSQIPAIHPVRYRLRRLMNRLAAYA